jgi:hypothetical protein
LSYDIDSIRPSGSGPPVAPWRPGLTVGLVVLIVVDSCSMLME